MEPLSGDSNFWLVNGTTMVVNNPIRLEYGFNNWSVSGTGSSINWINFTMGSANTTLTANRVKTITTFSYTGGEQTLTVTQTGTYKIELWGAQGGHGGQGLCSGGIGGVGGKGGYVSATTTLTAGEQLLLKLVE